MSKYLILNCDDFGQSLAANKAIMHLLEEGKVSSATIMPPAPAFREAAEWARSRPHLPLGLHLTLTSEFSGLRWKSLTGRASLHDESGFMHRTVADFEQYALAKDVKTEMRAQFQAVKKAGLRIIHVDNHMGSLYGLATGRSFLPHVLWQCAKRGMPFRIFRRIYPKDRFLASIPGAEKALAPVVALADTLGVGIPDYLLSHPYHIEEGETYDSFKRSLVLKLYDLPEGVSETYIHPAVPDAQLEKLIPSWSKRVWEYRLMLDPDFAYALKDAKVTLTNYAYVRDHMRKPRIRAAGSLLRLMLAGGRHDSRQELH
ncbi:polysaccharide deacetylase family protein [Paenibacillus ginsengarvi]|uniref:ChbG/HpnK family deacetylase n=1 Tax=Paenibacillus ginsengarvi TaxID=400777 RepID=A0A3B0BLF5_9BACL|nr:polysaccharide deacetylase family protein [Paenibacillus ginsengarvi]RKN72938.1 ChbG/HpnK family deacetylase [Paenibacillus ginsengarvi]